MTRHIMSRQSRHKGESAADHFRRIAKEKPNPKAGQGCRICGQDHRCPMQYWPVKERRIHLDAVEAGEQGVPTLGDAYGVELS